MPYKTLECEDCGCEFEGWHNAKYCESDRCNGSLEKECELCGQPFDVKPSQVEARQYCGRECSDKAMQEKVTLECQRCGERFDVIPYRAKSQEYCDRECAQKSQRERVDVECEVCGTSFEVIPSHADERAHCSKQCMIEAQEDRTGRDSPTWKGRKTIQCEQCGRDFKVPPSEAESRTYCGLDCRAEAYKKRTGENNPRWKGGYEDPYYGQNWHRMRRVVRNRDCFRCRKCGMHEDECDTELHVHHIVPLREFDEPEDANTPNNLVTVCPSCHSEVEGDIESGRALL